MIPLLTALLACWPDPVDLPCDPSAAGGSDRALVFDGPRPRNLLMISLDTFRRDRVGRYGGDAETDFLDGLLAAGVALDDHRSCSNWTYPSMLCALTGQSPTELGFMPATSGGEPYPLPGDIELLGDWLGRAGYDTHLVTANSLIGEKFGFSRSYQHLREENNASAYQLTAYAVEESASLDPSRPWFLHVHYMDGHVPYAPPARYLEGLEELDPISVKINERAPLEGLDAIWETLSESEQALLLAHLMVYYDGEQAYVDDQLEALLGSLEDRGLLADTLVVIYSDHGEQFWEHGEVLHHRELYQEESDAVALFWAPGLAPLSWSAPTDHADIAPTVLDALGLDIPREVRGSILGSRPEVCARFAYNLDGESGSQSVDYGGLRMIYDWDGGVWLYDRALDPAERRDILGERPEDALLLWSFLAPEVEALGALHPSAAPRRPRL